MEVEAVRYALEGREGWGLRPDLSRSRFEGVIKWAARQLEKEGGPNFDTYITRLLLVLVSASESDAIVKETDTTAEDDAATKIGAAIASMMQIWAKKVLTLRCLWKVWDTESLHVAEYSGHPSTLQCVFDCLRLDAEAAIQVLEKEILHDIDQIIFARARGMGKRTMSLLAFWTALWQIILIYRRQPLSGLNNETSEDLLVSLVVLYSGFFRSAKIIHTLHGPDGVASTLDGPMRDAYRLAWTSRLQFCKFSPSKDTCMRTTLAARC